MEKTSNKLVDLSIAFAVEILNLVKYLKEQRETIICNQIGRAGTSIGANIHEAQYAYGKADFVSKLQIALKEAIILHPAVDVLPYYKWGNDEKDTTSLGNRLLGPENGPFFDLCLMILKIIDEFEKNNFKLEK